MVFQHSRHTLAAAAILAIVASTFGGATHGPSRVVPQSASTVGVRGPATLTGAEKMSHPLWVILHGDVKAHYAPALRAGVWRRMTSNPANAYRLVNKMSHTRVAAATCHAAILAQTHTALPTKHTGKPTPTPIPTPPPPPSPPTGRPPGLIQAGNSKTTCISGEPDALASLLVTTGITYNCFLTYANADPGWADWVSPWNTNPGSPGGFPAWVNADPTGHQMIETMNLVPDAAITADPNWAQDCAANVSGTAAFPSSISSYATQLATTMVARGFGYTVMSFGPEMNGTWNRDSIGDTVAEQRAWAQCYAHIVTAMRSVPGANFLFEWAVNANYRNIPLANYYPGNAYVDLIGIDAYDASGVTLPAVSDPTRFAALAAEPLGLNAARDFAVAQRKPLSIPEWGLAIPAPGNNGGGDDPAYVTAMANFVESNDMAFQSFFNNANAGTLALGSTAPLATAAYINAFGS